jgi:hypothetical protein
MEILQLLCSCRCPLTNTTHNWTHCQRQSYVTTDGQSASLSWNKAPIWGLWPDLYYCLTVTAFWCGAHSLTRGRVCHLPESQSVVVSLLSVCTIYILHVIKRMYVCINVCICNIYKAVYNIYKCWVVLEWLHNWQLLKKKLSSVSKYPLNALDFCLKFKGVLYKPTRLEITLYNVMNQVHNGILHSLLRSLAAGS